MQILMILSLSHDLSKGCTQICYFHLSANDDQDEKCCPLVVDKLCVLAILLSIAGASIFLARTFQIELCNVNGADVNTPCVTGRKKRALGYYEEQLQLVLEGKHHEKV